MWPAPSRLRAHLARLEAVAGVTGAGSVEQRLARLVAPVESLAAGRQPSHTVTGLPTREPLLARMAADGEGLLGLLAFKDYDRLCAFDPALGERVLLVLAERVRQMLPPSRFVAQVDRGRLAVWINGAAPDEATRELDALAYALGGAIVEGGREILPEIELRHSRFTGGAAHATLARTLASFAASAPGEAVDPETAARERFLLEQDLRQAVARGELRLCYQPLVDAEESRVCGAEALLRWRHPVHGPVSPGRFVPVMEAAGLADEIGLWALNTALREARAWRAAGLGALTVAVNVSGHQLDDDALPQLIARTLARHSLGADALEVELTESVAMGDGERAKRLFAGLHALGIRIAIDDFGTGWSSLSTLRTLRFDKIKIDREFVTDVHRRRESQAICQSVIALGRGLGIRVLAEGVEQREELDWLRRHGCRYFQGFHFAKPLAAADFTTFVRDVDGLSRLLAAGPRQARRQIKQRLTT